MDIAFKVTTHGRAVMAACMALKAPLNLTRVAVGSGRVAEDIDLADIHQLLRYEGEGTVGERRHEDNRLYLTTQYSNRANPGVEMFLLSEFIVYAQKPDTGEETDFLYATLGDYVQSVPPCSTDFPAAVWNFPLTLVLSDEIEVTVSSPAGLVTYDDLTVIIQQNNTTIQQLIAQHNTDPAAHGNGRHVIAARERDPNQPDYGLPDNGGTVALHLGEYTGTAEVAAVLNGVEYDAENMRTSGTDAPNGTLILERLEADN